MVKPTWQIQRELQWAEARETYYKNNTGSTRTTVTAQPRTLVSYMPIFLRVGTSAPKIQWQASQKAVEWFGGVGKLGLKGIGVDGGDDKSQVMRAPRNFRPSMVRAMRGSGTPTAVKAFDGTGRRYIRYSAPTTNEQQAHYNAPISSIAKASPTSADVQATFSAIIKDKKDALGEYGRLYLELEQYNISGV